MTSTDALQNYREVGFVIVINPPLTPAKSINAIALETQLNEWVENHKFQLSLDCAGIDYLYSDTLNVLVRVCNRISKVGGVLALVHASDNIQKLVSNILSDNFLLFKNEPEIMAFSMRNPPPEHAEVPALEEARSVEKAPLKVKKAKKVRPVEETTESMESNKATEKLEHEKELSAIEKAKIEAKNKMELRQIKAEAIKKQKKTKLIVFGVFALLCLATALYLWFSGMLAKWLNEFIPGLF